MNLRDYIEKVLAELETGTGRESSEGGWVDVNFDLAVGYDAKKNVVVQYDSPSRIKFTLRVKRG